MTQLRKPEGPKPQFRYIGTGKGKGKGKGIGKEAVVRADAIHSCRRVEI